MLASYYARSWTFILGGKEYNMALFSRSKSTKGEAHVITQMPFTVKGAIIRTPRNAQSAEFGRQV